VLGARMPRKVSKVWQKRGFLTRWMDREIIVQIPINSSNNNPFNLFICENNYPEGGQFSITINIENISINHINLILQSSTSVPVKAKANFPTTLFCRPKVNLMKTSQQRVKKMKIIHKWRNMIAVTVSPIPLHNITITSHDQFPASSQLIISVTINTTVTINITNLATKLIAKLMQNLIQSKPPLNSNTLFQLIHSRINTIINGINIISNTTLIHLLHQQLHPPRHLGSSLTPNNHSQSQTLRQA
jgi:hypothetical protein